MEKGVEDKIKSLKDNSLALAFMVSEVNGYDNSLDGYEVHEFDDYFFDNFFSEKMEVARAVVFGEVNNWSDEWIRFNGYGNLESLSDFDYNKELEDGADEIINRFIELANDGNVDTEFLLETYGDEDA